MQLTKIPFIVGTIALSLVVTPLAVKAETNSLSPQIVAQVSPTTVMKRLGLTEEQKAQLAEIRQNTRAEIQNILTPQQQEQFQAMTFKMGQGMEAFRSLNLSDEQKSQVQDILQSQKSQIQEILTPEQMQKIQTLRQRSRNFRPFFNRSF
jgi:Spy/CpxP family protein refolding chaperone